MGIQEIFDNINNKENSFVNLPSIIEIDDFVKVSKYIVKGKKVTYGVNVRLSKDNSNEVLPFSYCNESSFNSKSIAQNVAPGFFIPDFIKHFQIKEAIFRVKYRRFSSRDVLITEIVDKGISMNPYIPSVNAGNGEKPMAQRFKEEFFDKSTQTFLHENIKGLKLPSGLIYVWIRGEDPEVTIDGNLNYLTNILAITNDWDIIEKIRKDKLSSILEFVMLLKSRLADDFDIKQKKESIKSAISAIMSRNMSHNLGSHYLYYTKADLENLANSQKDIAPQIRGTAKVLGYVQARMDYLATIISNDKYPYGAVNFKSQIFDELTIDDFSRRHFHANVENRITNFLLSNLVLSENFSRPDVRSNSQVLPVGIDPLSLIIKFSDDGKKYMVFTGTGRSEMDDDVLNDLDDGKEVVTKESEQEVKNLLSTLNIALPGSIMSSHALFNVIENFIRNSAKYMRDYTNKEKGLVFTIAIRPSLSKHTLEVARHIDLILYDNKKNANALIKEDEDGVSKEVTLFDSLLGKLASIEIVDDFNQLSKENKGLKEMLFSAIWMKSYSYGEKTISREKKIYVEKKTFADVVTDINNEKSLDNKLKMIEDYGFSLVRVAEDNTGRVNVYRRGESCCEDCNLGILIKLPLFKTFQRFYSSSNDKEDINSMLNIMADVVVINDDLKPEFKRAFTRAITVSELGSSNKPKENDYMSFYKAISNRFKDIDKYSICFVDTGNQNRSVIKEAEYDKKADNHKLYFLRHMTNNRKDMLQFQSYAYADTISGGDFTVTLLDLFKEGLDLEGHYKSNKDKIFALKIKESALTRITIIDERLYKSSCKDAEWLQLKNIRVLDYDEDKDNAEQTTRLTDIFKGNNFRDGKSNTHFLSIHLGLIEKILKNSVWINNEISKRLESKDSDSLSNHLAPKRVSKFMEILTEHFNGNSPEETVFIAIHSGRGNFSAELDASLAKYPFISLSALENVFHNSKYQLAQLFYNTVYIGKGYANHQQ